MIIGVGTDIVDHGENAKLLAFDELGLFPIRIFVPSELAVFQQQSNPAFIAGRFAAKEAMIKALGIGMYDGISLKDIEIHTTQHGQPMITLSGYIKAVADAMKVNKWHLSISHSKNYSIAVAIAES
jgi:holo-[acyl-carrier protein] synthase